MSRSVIRLSTTAEDHRIAQLAAAGVGLALVAQQVGAATRPMHTTASSVIGTLLVAAGAGVIAFATVQHARFVRTLPASDLPPSYKIGWALGFSIAFSVLGTALAIYLALS